MEEEIENMKKGGNLGSRDHINIEQLESKINALEVERMSTTVVIQGIPMNQNPDNTENTQKKVANFFANKSKIPDILITEAKQVRKSKNPDEPTIFVKLSNTDDKWKILKSFKLLAGTPVRINERLSKRDMDTKKLVLQERRRLINPGKNMKMKSFKSLEIIEENGITTIENDGKSVKKVEARKPKAKYLPQNNFN